MRPGIYTYGRAQSISAALEMAAPEVSLPGHGAIGRSSNRNQLIYIYIYIYIFGRNKSCTKLCPDHLWVHYCRKHYLGYIYIYIYIYGAPNERRNGQWRPKKPTPQRAGVPRITMVPGSCLCLSDRLVTMSKEKVDRLSFFNF